MDWASAGDCSRTRARIWLPLVLALLAARQQLQLRGLLGVVLQRAQHGALQERIGGLDRRDLRRDDQHRCAPCSKKSSNVVTDARAHVDEDDVGVQGANAADDPLLLAVVDVRGPQPPPRACHQVQFRVPGGVSASSAIRSFDPAGPGCRLGTIDAEQDVLVGGAQVTVHQHDACPVSAIAIARLDATILLPTPLAATHGDDAVVATSLPEIFMVTWLAIVRVLTDLEIDPAADAGTSARKNRHLPAHARPFPALATSAQQISRSWR